VIIVCLSDKLIRGLYLDPDQDENLITSRESPIAHAHHVSSTSTNAYIKRVREILNAFVRY